MDETMLLIAGGALDKNLSAIVRAAGDLGVACEPLLLTPGDKRSFCWEVETDVIYVSGAPVRPSAVFVRQDVFSWLSSGKEADRIWAREWYQAIMGYVASRAGVRCLNKAFASGSVNKIHALLLAKSLGLRIPKTLVANIPPDGAEADWVVKPLSGGDYCRNADEVFCHGADNRAMSPAPIIMQPKLLSPDLRIYRIGDQWFSFRIESEHLDHRVAPAQLVGVPNPAMLVEGLRRLTDTLRLDFAAADFKRCGGTGRMLFLEVNSSPMFAGADRVCNSSISKAIVEYLAA